MQEQHRCNAGGIWLNSFQVGLNSSKDVVQSVKETNIFV